MLAVPEAAARENRDEGDGAVKAGVYSTNPHDHIARFVMIASYATSCVETPRS